ncbi:unnamed protein product [Lampetra planeri]
MERADDETFFLGFRSRRLLLRLPAIAGRRMSGRAVRSLVAWCALVAIAAPFSAAVANIACDKPADIVHGNWSWVNSITIVYSCQPGFLLGGADHTHVQVRQLVPALPALLHGRVPTSSSGLKCRHERAGAGEDVLHLRGDRALHLP